MMERSWFKTKSFTVLEIEEFKSISSREVIQSKTITDSSVIQSLVDRIEQIDPNGDMMVSWGPDAQYMTLTFRNGDERDVVQIIQQKFKTPSTGFHSRNELESSIYGSIQLLLD